MSINIRTNFGSILGSLSEQGTFRNSMYRQGEEKKEKKSVTAPLTVVKDDLPEHFMENEIIRMQSAGLHSEISHVEEDMSIVQTVARALSHVEDSMIQMQELLVIVSNEDRKSTRLNSSHKPISYAVFFLKKKKTHTQLHSST